MHSTQHHCFLGKAVRNVKTSKSQFGQKNPSNLQMPLNMQPFQHINRLVKYILRKHGKWYTISVCKVSEFCACMFF